MSDSNPPQGKNNEISKRINTRINKIEEKTNPRDADEKEIKQKSREREREGERGRARGNLYLFIFIVGLISSQLI